jgi:hypothetical protein
MSVSMLDIKIDSGSHEMPVLVMMPKEEIKQKLETKFAALVL